MAREKGTGSLQRERSGRWTARVTVKGKRYSRSTRTTNREKAEAFLNRFLAPFGLGERVIPLADVWREYEKSPNRKDLTPSTMNSKRLVWMNFATWIEANHLEITHLNQLTSDAIAEYLRVFRLHHTASTYNKALCVLREVSHVVGEQADMDIDPWERFRLLPDDSHTRREFTRDELKHVMDAAARAGEEWRLLFAVGMYTGLRLGDCCLLSWDTVNLDRKVIQTIPRKTRKFAKGKPLTIPIHPSLMPLIDAADKKPVENEDAARSNFVMPMLAAWYMKSHWRVDAGLKDIFASAGITTSIRIEGRKTTTPDATFHSLRHTFVSFSANAGVPLPVVSSIVGHTSTAMTRHYYHENETELRRAVESVPSLETLANPKPSAQDRNASSADAETPKRAESISFRLRRLQKYLSQGIITEEEHTRQRAKIIAEI